MESIMSNANRKHLNFPLVLAFTDLLARLQTTALGSCQQNRYVRLVFGSESVRMTRFTPVPD